MGDVEWGKAICLLGTVNERWGGGPDAAVWMMMAGVVAEIGERAP
jgi:hypothetical protein